MSFCGGNKPMDFCCFVLQQMLKPLLHDKISVLTKLFFVVYVRLRCFYLCLRHLSLCTRTQSMQNCANRLTPLCGKTDRRTLCRDDISIFGAVIGERFAFLCGGERRFGLIVRIWVAGCRVCPAVCAHRNVLLCLSVASRAALRRASCRLALFDVNVDVGSAAFRQFAALTDGVCRNVLTGLSLQFADFGGCGIVEMECGKRRVGRFCGGASDSTTPVESDGIVQAIKRRETHRTRRTPHNPRDNYGVVRICA